MSPGEIAWRLEGKVRDAVDRAFAVNRARPVPAAGVCAEGRRGDWCEAVVGDWLPVPGKPPGIPGEAGWLAPLVARAERLCEHRLDLFDLQDHPLGDPIRWNYDYKAQKATPLQIASSIDYRDVQETGDCKFVWEPSRHQHWVVLARAYRLTGDSRYAGEILAQLESWAEQCPFGQGMQWRSPLELGIRIINWVWALELIRPSGLLSAPLIDRISGLAYRHLWETARKYSKYSSANNHRVGEAAGVFIGSSYFSDLRRADSWQRESRQILIEEIFEQTHEDGGTREQATGYHLFSLEFFLVSALAGRRIGCEFPAEYWRRLESMFEYLACLTEGGGLPMFGDADDGHVLDLGPREQRIDSLLAVGAVLFGRPEWKSRTSTPPEALFWMLGDAGCEEYAKLPAETRPEALTSRALPGSGYFLLQSGTRGRADAMSVVMDCGELGFGSIAAHGHADALSFVLRVGGKDIFVDPGTYDYFTYPSARAYFRSTRAHNTIVIDDMDQSESLGLFLWGQRAAATCRRWEPAADGGLVCGTHDGYRRLGRPVTHERTLELHAGELAITDVLAGEGEHVSQFFLHLAEECDVKAAGPGRFIISRSDTRLELELGDCWSARLMRGSDQPMSGWVSRGYHRRTPSFSIACDCRWEGSLTTRSRVRLLDCANGDVDSSPARSGVALSGCRN